MKNWKTTIVGASLAVLMAIQPLIDAVGGQDINWMQLIFAGALALLGYLSKDAGVSGTAK